MQNDSNVETPQAEIPNTQQLDILTWHLSILVNQLDGDQKSLTKEIQTIFESLRLGKNVIIQKDSLNVITDLSNEVKRLKYLVGEKIGHPSARDMLDAEISRQLQEQIDNGEKEFITDEDIEKLIQDVLKDHDENPDKYWHNLYAQIDDLIEINNELSSPLLQNDCMIGQTWFMKGTPVANLIKHAEKVYKAEAIAQNSKIEFGTDDGKSWFAHDVPFFGTVQMDQIEEHGIVEWDIHFNECWQGPFNSKSRCIQHLEECIQEMREEQAQEGKDHV